MKPIFCVFGESILVTEKKYFVLTKNGKFYGNKSSDANDDWNDSLCEINEFIQENVPEEIDFVETERGNDGLNIKYCVYICGKQETNSDILKTIASDIGLVFSKEYQKIWGI